jgi:peptidoglycan/xylan/chitin deacetylase (PgdA/CDA1 family)
LLTRRTFASGALSVVAILPAVAQASAVHWPKGARAAVSLTYDDGLNSQLDTVVPALQDAGFKGTFFLTLDNMRSKAADWQAAHRLGHEMGNHSVTHPCALRHCTRATFDQKEIAPMEAFLDETFGPDRFHSFAYPCGFVGLGEGVLSRRIARYHATLKGRVAAARTVSGLANDPAKALADPLMLNAFEPTYDVDDPRQAFRYVRQAMARGGWAILVFHEVLERRLGEGDTSRATHAAVLQWLAAQPVWCAPLGEVFRYCAAGAG